MNALFVTWRKCVCVSAASLSSFFRPHTKCKRGGGGSIYFVPSNLALRACTIHSRYGRRSTNTCEAFNIRAGGQKEADYTTVGCAFLLDVRFRYACVQSPNLNLPDLPDCSKCSKK
jgi:hypothetical protein